MREELTWRIKLDDKINGNTYRHLLNQIHFQY